MIRGTCLAIAAMCLIGGSGSRAFAQTTSQPVVVVVEGSGVGTPDGVRRAVSRELGVAAIPVSDPRANAARGVLTISVAPDHQLTLVYRDALGRELWRTTSMPRDPVGAVATIAMLAGNLARNEADELLGGPPVQTSPVLMPAPPPTAVTVEPAAPVAAPLPVMVAPEAPPAPEVPIVVQQAQPTVIVLPARSTTAVVDSAPPSETQGPLSRDTLLGFVGETVTRVNAPSFDLQWRRRFGLWSAGVSFGGAYGVGMSDNGVNSSRAALFGLVERNLFSGTFTLDVGVGLGSVYRWMVQSNQPAAVPGLPSDAYASIPPEYQLSPAAKIFATLDWQLGSSIGLVARVEGTGLLGSDAIDGLVSLGGSIGVRISL